ncbi:uncharacterized protein TNCV_1812771 [Trichonephila clavipes]|uniref:Uncharacterized protein n=1 Tax=Trichonephila clavipes TaxID=2585209 RepID=A0A8X6W807_TRICX|nr:uncharacterized protein TNCV_1812771 [Trichonephila clavipes]
MHVKSVESRNVLPLDSLPGCNACGRSSLMAKVTDSRSACLEFRVPLKTRRVGERCTLNLSRAQTSSRWYGVVAWRGRCQLGCRSRHFTMVQNYVVRRQRLSCS